MGIPKHVVTEQVKVLAKLALGIQSTARVVEIDVSQFVQR